ncbi:MAG: hypothetical protein KA713_03980 [Chryseotalea sp. WA131a]|nr:MAG: hypothetical protein KA713_03980 [Chryseotalea sp. WA131a]
MTPTQLLGNKRIRSFFLLIAGFFMLLSCAKNKNDAGEELSDFVKRGKVFKSENGNNYIFIDTDSTFIINRKKENIFHKEIGVVKTVNNELIFFQGTDHEKLLNTTFHNGNSTKLLLNITKQIIEDYPSLALIVNDTLVFPISDTTLLIDKKAIFDLYQKENKNNLPFFGDWGTWNRLFVNDLILKSSKGYLAMFHDSAVEKIEISNKSIKHLDIINDSICFKMKTSGKHLVCTECPTRIGIDTLFQK